MWVKYMLHTVEMQRASPLKMSCILREPFIIWMAINSALPALGKDYVPLLTWGHKLSTKIVASLLNVDINSIRLRDKLNHIRGSLPGTCHVGRSVKWGLALLVNIWIIYYFYHVPFPALTNLNSIALL